MKLDSTSLLRPLLVLACVALLLGTGSFGLGSCGPPPVKRAYEAYTAQLDPLLTQEARVWERQVDLLVPTRMDRYYQFLRTDGLPFYEDLAQKVAAIDPADPALEPAQEHLEEFARLRLEYARLAASLEDLATHYDKIGRVDDAEGKLQAAVKEYSLALKQGDAFDPRYTEVMNMTDAFALNYMERLKRGDIEADVVQTRLRGHVLERMGEIREKLRVGDDDISHKLRSVIVACHELHKRMLEELPSIEAVFSSTRRSQTLINASSEKLETFREVLRQVRRKF